MLATASHGQRQLIIIRSGAAVQAEALRPYAAQLEYTPTSELACKLVRCRQPVVSNFHFLEQTRAPEFFQVKA